MSFILCDLNQMYFDTRENVCVNVYVTPMHETVKGNTNLYIGR